MSGRIIDDKSMVAGLSKLHLVKHKIEVLRKFPTQHIAQPMASVKL